MSLISSFKKSFATSLASLDWTNLSDIVKLQLHVTDFGAVAVIAMKYEDYDKVAGNAERAASLDANGILAYMTRFMLTEAEYNTLQPLIVASVNENMRKHEQTMIDKGYETQETIDAFHAEEEARDKLLASIQSALNINS